MTATAARQIARRLPEELPRVAAVTLGLRIGQLDAASAALDAYGRFRGPERAARHLDLIEQERAADRAVIEAARDLIAALEAP